MINKTKEPLVGIEIIKSWPDGIPPPKIKEKIFEGSNYLTATPHGYETIAGNVVLDKMYSLNRTVETANPKIGNKERITAIRERLENYRSKFPVVSVKFDQNLNFIPSYFVSPDVKHKGKSINEAQTLTETVHEKHRALIVGKGPEADLMYKNMVNRLGEANVKRVDLYKDDKTLQLEAKRFGADVIFGVKEVGGVHIDPKLSKAGKGGAETKKKVINSKPSDNTLYWDYK